MSPAVYACFQGVKLLYLVHLGVEETSVSLCPSLHKGGVGDVGSDALDDNILGAMGLLLVGSLRAYLLLPLFFSQCALCITFVYVTHYSPDRLVYATFTSTCASHQYVHQGCFVLHVVDVFEACLPQVCSQGREYGVRHGRFVDVWSLADEVLDERRQLLWHHWWQVTTFLFEGGF